MNKNKALIEIVAAAIAELNTIYENLKAQARIDDMLSAKEQFMAKFTFLKDQPEELYDDLFAKHVPDLVTLLTYGVFVEFTELELPTSMRHLCNLQDELRETKSRGYTGIVFPDDDYNKRMNELFPIVPVPGNDENSYDFLKIIMGGWHVTSFDESILHDDLIVPCHIDEMECEVCASMSDDDEPYDPYAEYEDKYLSQMCICDMLNSSDAKTILGFMKTVVAKDILIHCLYTLENEQEWLKELPLDDLLIVHSLFIYYGYDTTVILETIHKYNPNLAIRIALYPHNDILRLICMVNLFHKSSTHESPKGLLSYYNYLTTSYADMNKIYTLLAKEPRNVKDFMPDFIMRMEP